MCVINYVRCLAYAFSDMDILNNICVVSACVDLQERTKMTSIIVWYGGFVHILFAKIEKQFQITKIISVSKILYFFFVFQLLLALPKVKYAMHIALVAPNEST